MDFHYFTGRYSDFARVRLAGAMARKLRTDSLKTRLEVLTSGIGLALFRAHLAKLSFESNTESCDAGRVVFRGGLGRADAKPFVRRDGATASF